MSLYHSTQLCGDKPAVHFWQHKTELSDVLYCVIDENLTLEARHIRLLSAALDVFEAAQADAPVAASAEVSRMRDALEALSNIHDSNPSDEMCGMTDAGYARHMLGEARAIARAALEPRR